MLLDFVRWSTLKMRLLYPSQVRYLHRQPAMNDLPDAGSPTMSRTVRPTLTLLAELGVACVAGP